MHNALDLVTEYLRKFIQGAAWEGLPFEILNLHPQTACCGCRLVDFQRLFHQIEKPL